MTKLEMERRWLLKRVPATTWTEEIVIHQFYLHDAEGKRFRLRVSTDLATGTHSWVWNRKEEVQPGVNEETERDVAPAEALALLQNNAIEKDIEKIRRKAIADGLTYEVDEYKHMALVVMEVEFDTLDEFEQPRLLPEPFAAQVITELTYQKDFSNYNLAEASRYEHLKTTAQFTGLAIFAG